MYQTDEMKVVSDTICYKNGSTYVKFTDRKVKISPKTETRCRVVTIGPFQVENLNFEASITVGLKLMQNLKLGFEKTPINFNILSNFTSLHRKYVWLILKGLNLNLEVLIEAELKIRSNIPSQRSKKS